MNVEQIIRKLAKESKYQNLFVATKDLNGFVLFKNNIDLSRIQEVFLSYLYFYYDIYQDISTKKIDKIILSDEIYEDAYMYWKKIKGNEKESNKKTQKKQENTSKNIMLVFDNKVKSKEK